GGHRGARVASPVTRQVRGGGVRSGGGHCAGHRVCHHEDGGIFMTPQTDLPVSLPDTEAPVRMCLPEAEADAAALKQLRTIASLPWVYGVRVMPDVHLGIGATVGSVSEMRGAVSAAAVGVDIGCGVAA